jgi:N-acetyl-gamma-glutamyl-phosphate reductase
MKRVAVVGATGYAGAELVRILAGHPEVALSLITSRQYAGTPIATVYPAFAGAVDLVCETFDADAIADRADVVFTALPHQLPMEIVPDMVRRGLRVVDLSADFRFRDVDAYAAAYQPHAAPELSAAAAYGLSEIYTEAVRTADVVGNPGCYPTSILLPLVPLLRAGRISPDGLIADAKSGVSGAGRSPGLGTHFPEVHESFKAYKVGSHRHAPEMNEVLSREAGKEVGLTFVPHLVPMSRGMLSTLYADPLDGLTAAEARDILGAAYADRPFVRVCPAGLFPATRAVRGANRCDIGVDVDPVSGRLILISAIDNLVKGAAGQAVQNLNLMLGFPETAGLDAVPYPL